MSMPRNPIQLALFWLASLSLGLWLSCARQALPLAEDPALAGADDFLGADLQQAGRELTGDPWRDRARLDLVEGREDEPRPCGGGWLLQLRRAWDGGAEGGAGSQALLLWLGPGPSGSSRLLARADSLRVVALQGEGGRLESVRLLLVERVQEQGRAWRQLVQRDLRGGGHCLARLEADRLDWQAQAQALRVAVEREAPPFRESPGSWHLEALRPLLETEGGWKLGPPRPLDSPYRALSEFLDAARRGHWRRAGRRADLSRLLALPDGSWSPALQASLESGMSDLLQRRLVLAAPRKGKLVRVEDLSGRQAWRVALEPRLQAEGEPRWLVTGLERVIKP